MFKILNLPYNKNSLEPYISQNAMSFHYDKHHQTYCDNLNNLSKDTEYEKLSLIDVVKLANVNKIKSGKDLSIFNNAAQVLNHDFYWSCMKKSENSEPSGAILELINKDFDQIDLFKEQFVNNAISQFGSGWCWTVFDKNNNKIEIIKTSNAEAPFCDDNKLPLFVVDVWEHAYYLDYQNKRLQYVRDFINHLVNWDFVNNLLSNV